MPAWVTIQTFMYPHEASLTKAKLESAGIECFIQDELTTQVVSAFSNALGGAKLQVPKDQAEKARNILIEGGFIVVDKEKLKNHIAILNAIDYPDKEKCPFCKSDNIDTIVNPSTFVILFYFILGVIFPIFKSWEKCYDCEKQWKYKKLKS